MSMLRCAACTSDFDTDTQGFSLLCPPCDHETTMSTEQLLNQLRQADAMTCDCSAADMGRPAYDCDPGDTCQKCCMEIGAREELERRAVEEEGL